MQVKTFTGSSDKDVLDQIKAELGTEAVIIESRRRKENGRTLVCMTAALERLEPDAASARIGNPAPQGESYPGWLNWQHEWQAIKSQLFALMKPGINTSRLDPRQKAALEFLEREGASDQALVEVYRRLSDKPGVPVLKVLADIVPVKPWSFENWPQRVHLVCGPYGSGKTITAVRLALAIKQRSRSGPGRVCIVNVDAERGNGRLLLRHYTGLTDIGYREAANAFEMSGVLSEVQSQGFDRIVIDMPGMGRGTSMASLYSRLGLDKAVGVQSAMHLVLSPHYDDKLLLNLLGRYRLDIPGSIVWSKLDESGHFGAILNIALASGLPVSALSYGPGLLNSLVPASQTMLWRLLFKRELPVVSTPVSDSGDSYE